MGESIQDIATLSPTKRALFELLLKEKGLKVSRIQPIPRGSETQSFPLSFAQQRVWFLDQLEPGNPVYNEATTVRLTGSVNAAALEYSLNEIIRRHEILRTTFAIERGEPVQFVSPSQTLTLSITDLRQLPSDEREPSLQQLSAQKAAEPFDLKKGPLIRANLFQIDEELSVLGLIIHHIVTDGWSSRILIREMTALYEFYCAEKTGNGYLQKSPLPELPIQYIDFAYWQRQWLQGEVLKEQLSYWKNQLDGRLPVLDLPTDRQRPAIQTFRGARQSLRLSKELSEALAGFSRAEGVTLFMTLLAAFQTLLYRHTGQEDILVGSPIAGRNRAEIETLIGFFINTLVLRTYLSGNPSFRELLSQVRQVALGAYAHQDLPFEKLVEELQPERDLSRTPLFQVFFNMLNFEQNSIELPGLTLQTLPRPELESKFDLTLYARESVEGTQLEFVYNADLFEPARMAEMLAQLQQLIEQAVKNPEEKIAGFSLITPSAQAVLPNPKETPNLGHLEPEWEDTAHSQFCKQAKRVPERTALIDKQVTWSYAELDSASNQLANYLRKNGIQSQDVVAIYAHRSASLVLALLGILKAGAAFVILDSNYPAERLIDCIKLANPKCLIQIETAGKIPKEIKAIVSNFSISSRLNLPPSPAAARALLKTYSIERPKVEINLDDLAYIAFTSGSTGKPKGILGTHKPLSHFLQWHTQTFNLNESDRFSMLSGLSHDPLLRDIFTPLCLGATLCIPTPEGIGTPGWLAEWMKQQEISITHLTPAMGQLLCEGAGSKQLTNLRYAFLGGDVLTVQDVSRLRALAPDICCVNFYGATETPQAMGYFIVPHQENHSEKLLNSQLQPQLKIPLGRGIKDVQLLILNAAQQPAGIGEIGEIYIRTSYLAKGYLGDEAMTAERFITNPVTKLPDDRLYKTGDLGRYLTDGNIAVLGRADNQVKIRGFRIEPGEIEAVLNRHPNVRQSAVIARENGLGDKRLIAYIVPQPSAVSARWSAVESRRQMTNDEGQLLVSELRSFLKERLPDYLVPPAFVMLEEVPLTPNGKVDRRALPATALDLGDLKESYVAPRDALELQLTEIWETVLNVKPISVKANFFNLGGHSLLAVRLFSQIEEKFAQLLPLATLFQAPTVEQLANKLRSEEKSAPMNSLVPIQPAGSKKPLFCIHAIGGNVLSYQGVATYIGQDQPVYGLQARGIDGQQTPHTRVEDMATDYIKEICSIQPDGPYLLAGHSLGGIIAFEMAQQLVRAGQKVALLAVFDTFSPLEFGKGTPPASYQFYIHRLNLSRLKPKDKITYITDRVFWKIEGFIEKMRKKFDKSRGGSLPNPLPEHFRRIEVANRVAAKDYVPQVYPGRVTLLRAIERPTTKYYEPLLGWGELAAGGVDIQEIPGHHVTIILEPRVRFLAEKLKACIDKALAEEG